mgnify:CR=1 FL=1
MPAEFDTIVSAALQIWRECDPLAVGSGAEDAERYRPLFNAHGDHDVNLIATEMNSDDPKHFRHQIIIEADGPMHAVSRYLGEHPDHRYLDMHVLASLARAQLTVEPQVEVVSARLDRIYVNFDRLILPQRVLDQRPRWAVTIARPNLVFPLPVNPPAITRRESEILDFLIAGLSAKEIARQVGLSPRTVENAIASLKMKFRARNVTHLVSLAIAKRLAGA